MRDWTWIDLCMWSIRHFALLVTSDLKLTIRSKSQNQNELDVEKEQLNRKGYIIKQDERENIESNL